MRSVTQFLTDYALAECKKNGENNMAVGSLRNFGTVKLNITKVT